jgi:hypothetical protein
MGLWDYAILALLAGAVALVIWRSRRKAGRACCGNCAACQQCRQGRK